MQNISLPVQHYWQPSPVSFITMNCRIGTFKSNTSTSINTQTTHFLVTCITLASERTLQYSVLMIEIAFASKRVNDIFTVVTLNLRLVNC